MKRSSIFQPADNFDMQATVELLEKEFSLALTQTDWELATCEYTAGSSLRKRGPGILVCIKNAAAEQETFLYFEQAKYPRYEDVKNSINSYMAFIEIRKQFPTFNIREIAYETNTINARIPYRGSYACSPTAFRSSLKTIGLTVALNECYNFQTGVFYPHQFITLANETIAAGKATTIRGDGSATTFKLVAPADTADTFKPIFFMGAMPENNPEAGPSGP